MAELSKGHVFVPGEVVDPADLNDLVDAATASKGIVMDQPLATPVPADDSIGFYDLSADNLARCKISALPSGVTSVHLTAAPTSVFNVTGTPTITTSGTFGVDLKNQSAGKFLAGPVSGTATTPSFRVLSPADLPIGTVTIAALAIDWNLGSMFIKQLVAGNQNFTFTNASHGQTIRVLLFQDATGAAATVGWPSIRWPGGTNPVMTPHGIDIYTFHEIGGIYYGTFDQNFKV